MAQWTQDVYSTDAASIGYDDETQTLFITFQRGGTYAYQGVPEDVAQDCANAASVGNYINEEIKGRYSYRRIG